MKTLANFVVPGGVQTGPFGSQLHAEDYTATGVGVVMPQDLGDNEVVMTRMARISSAKADDLARHRLLAGDIVYSRRGDVTRRALVREHDAEMICGTGCLRVRIDPSKADPRYLSYALGTPAAQEWIIRHAVGATMANLNTKILSALPLEMPTLSEQRLAAEVLGTLDDKIAANRRVAGSADTLRAALWEQLTDGAPQVSLSSIARFINGKAFTKDATRTGKVVIRIAELNSGIGGSTIYNDIEVAEDHLARPGDLLMAWSGSLTIARWYRSEAIVNQHIFKVIPADTELLWAVACAAETKMLEFKKIAATKATTMGHIQRRHLDEPVHWPDLSDAERDLGDNLWTRALLAERESEQIVATRNELLPLLMSEKITIKDAEERVEQEV